MRRPGYPMVHAKPAADSRGAMNKRTNDNDMTIVISIINIISMNCYYYY